MDKKLILVGAVAILMLLTTMVPLFASNTSTAATSYPDAPHTGDAYVGEFWLEEMDVSALNSSHRSMAMGHVRAEHDWVVYDPNSSIVVNYSFSIGDSHPWFNVTIYLEVFCANSSNVSVGSMFVGNVWRSLNCTANTSYNLQGNLSFPLGKIEFSGGNLTLVCVLKGVIRSRVNFGGLAGAGDEEKNLTFLAEDRCVVAVEEKEETDSVFSYYFEYARRCIPFLWEYVPGLEDQSVDTQNNWCQAQTVFMVGMPLQTNDSGNNTNQWPLGDLIFQDLLFRTRIYRFIPGTQSMTWETNTTTVSGKAWITYRSDKGAYAIPAVLMWRLYPVKESNHGGGFGVRVYIPYGKPMSYPGRILGSISGALPEGFDGSEYSIGLHGKVRVNRDYEELTGYVLTIKVVNDSGGNNSNSSPNWNWESEVAYRVSNLYTIGVTSVAEADGVTVVKANIKDFLMNMGDNEFLYTFGADTGNNRINFYCE